MMISDLKERFIRAENDFLSSILDSKVDQLDWSTLHADFCHAAELGKLDYETTTVAHTVSSRVSIVAKCFMQVREEEEKLKSQMLQGVQEVLDAMGRLDINSRSSSPRLLGKSRDCIESSPLPSHPPEASSFIAHAYQWLLDNLHNPYPSLSVKTDIVTKTGCSMSSLNSWFTSARRRMGWTNICRDRFNNCRADTVDAAYRALVKEDPSRRVLPDLAHAFMVMKVAAEGLYSSTFSCSALAGDLDAVVKDMTEEDRGLVQEAKRREADEAKLVKERQKEMRRKQRVHERKIQKHSVASGCYPSPRRSRTSSPQPEFAENLTDDSDVDEDIIPPAMVGRKRRSSSLDERVSPASGDEPQKRLRMASSSDLVSSLSSPSSTASNAGASSDDDTPACGASVASSSPLHSNAVPTMARKRRLSDEGAESFPKRPRSLDAGPRPHAVSDPLPKSAAANELGVDDWFKSNFGSFFALPSPVDSGAPDHSTPLEVEFFSDYRIPEDLYDVGIKPLTLGSTPDASHATGPVVDLVEFDNLLQSIGGSDLVTISGPVEPSAPASLLPARADAVLSSHQATLPSVISSSIDWSLLLDNSGPFTTTANATFCSPDNPLQSDPQSISEIDISVLQLPSTLPLHDSGAIVPLGSSSVQAKFNQLQAMQEAVRQMEREILQSEGLV
ncbi:homeodomain protein 1 [Phlebopus sp. FC_14]|nr:homeodomain protein 1 [Phlebopus sp. FC_14]